MPDIPGTNVSAPVRPYHTDCTYPTALADEIAGGLKYVASETQLADIPAERCPVGTVVSVGFGRFRQWTGTNWQAILQGLEPPSVTYTSSEVRLQFDTVPVSLKPVNATNAGVMLPSMYSRLMGHGKNHLQNGDDAIAATTSTPNLIPQADKYGKISSGWLPFGSRETGGIVRVADNGTSPPDATGTPVAVVRANDSRLARIPELLTRLEELSFPIRYVTELPAKNAASKQSFYWLSSEETLYLLIDQTWTAIAGRRVTGQAGKSAYEIAQDQGYPGSIDEWLVGLRGTNGLDGEDGKSAYDLARAGGFIGTLPEWLASLKGTKGDRGEQGEPGACGEPGEQGKQGAIGTDGKSAYELAVALGYSGSEPDWLTSLKGDKGVKGEQGEPGEQGEQGGIGPDGKSAYELAAALGYSGSESGWIASLQGASGASAYESARSNGFIGTESDWLASLRGDKGEQGEKGEQGRGIAVLDYFDTYAELIAVHPTGFPGDFYGADGDLYLWAQGRWKNLGRLIGAIAFEFELLMEQAGIEGTSFEDFFRELVNEALTEKNLSPIFQTEIESWMTIHFSSRVTPLVINWLNQNAGSFLNDQIAVIVANQLPTQLASHVSAWHEWSSF